VVAGSWITIVYVGGRISVGVVVDGEEEEVRKSGPLTPWFDAYLPASYLCPQLRLWFQPQFCHSGSQATSLHSPHRLQLQICHGMILLNGNGRAVRRAVRCSFLLAMQLASIVSM
jgi:hypothetical protein